MKIARSWCFFLLVFLIRVGLYLHIEYADVKTNEEIEQCANWNAGRTHIQVSSKLLVVVFLSLRHFLHSDDKDTSWWTSSNVFRNLASMLQQKDYQVDLGIKVLLSRVANQTNDVYLRKILKNIEEQLYSSCLKVEGITLCYECDMAYPQTDSNGALKTMMRNFVCRFDHRFVKDSLLLASKSSCPELRLSTAAADKSLSISFEFSSGIVPGRGRGQARSAQRLDDRSNDSSVIIIPQVSSAFLVCMCVCVCVYERERERNRKGPQP